MENPELYPKKTNLAFGEIFSQIHFYQLDLETF